MLLLAVQLIPLARAQDPRTTAYVTPGAVSGGDGSQERPFSTILEAVTAGLNQPPSVLLWTVVLLEGTYQGADQSEIAIRDTKEYVFSFQNGNVTIACGAADYFVDFSGLGGRGSLVVQGNNGTISGCRDSAIRSRHDTAISSVRFVGSRAQNRGSAVRVLAASDAAVHLSLMDCVFLDHLQRPVVDPSHADDEGGGAVWVGGAKSVLITRSRFADNEATQGGGAYIVDCETVLVGRCVFERNSALLDTVGGGGLAFVSRFPSSQPSLVTIHDSLFQMNRAGGAAAGIYVGGTVNLNLTRVVISNNTSFATSVESSPSLLAAGNGVGMLVYGEVIGTLVNTTIVRNHLQGSLNSGDVGSLNLGCSGSALSNFCTLMWNGICDVCRRQLSAVELSQFNKPCALSAKLVMNSAVVAYMVIASLIVVMLAAAAIVAVVLHRRWKRGRRDYLLLQEQQLRLQQLESHQNNGFKNAAEDETESVSIDAVKRSDEGLIGEEFGDCPLEAMDVPRYGSASSGSDEVLPSRDFELPRQSPGPGSFKEIACEELKLDPDPIGSGAFGLVYRAVWRGSVVAVKKYIGTMTEQSVQAFKAEAQLMHQIGSHPNVIKLFGACTVGPNYCLVVPYYHRRSMREYFFAQPKESRTWSVIVSYALQIVAGMMHLHRENLVHRDLAARNILVDDSNTLVITDFGLARFVLHTSSGQTKSNVGAVAWMSPEAVTKRRYSKKSDVWSFGVVLWELCVGELPFAGIEPIHIAVEIASGVTLAIPDTVPPVLAGVMRSCWAREPVDRPSFEELYDQLQHILQMLK